MKKIRKFSVLVIIGMLVSIGSFSLLIRDHNRHTIEADETIENQQENLNNRLELPEKTKTSKNQVGTALDRLPFYFEQNKGQTDINVKFLSRGDHYTLYLTSSEAVLSLDELITTDPLERNTAEVVEDNLDSSNYPKADGNVIRIQFLGAKPNPIIEGLAEQSGKSNYLLGNDPEKWQTNVPHYDKVIYKNLYSGIDMIFYFNNGHLEYDFIVAPGADPYAITLRFKGALETKIDAEGDLILQTQGGAVVQPSPVIYQEMRDGREKVTGGYLMLDEDQIGFQVGAYDPERTLIIDPVLTYSTYLGGSGDDDGNGLSVDASGNMYVAGRTTSPDFPTMNPFQGTFAGGHDSFLTKIDSAGSTLVYSTYLGGSNNDFGRHPNVDSAGNVYMTGFTYSSDFPTAGTPFQGSFAGYQDAFVTKFNPSGSDLVYSTYLGGSSVDRGFAMTIDETGNAYVTGTSQSTNFPTQNPFQASKQGTRNVIVTKLDSSGSSLIYSTYIGGSGYNNGLDIVVDSAGNAYVTGAAAVNFPTVNAFQPTYGGGNDAYVLKLSPSGSSLIYSTYLGGYGQEAGAGIVVDADGNAYVSGITHSSNFPTLNPVQGTFGGVSDAYVVKLDTTGSLVYSTFLGGSGDEGSATLCGVRLALDGSGNIWVTGRTGSTDFPTQSPTQASIAGNFDVFVTQMDPSGSALLFSTYLGGSSAEFPRMVNVDSFGNVYVSGFTQSQDFPLVNPLQATFGGVADVFIVKFGPDNAPPTITSITGPIDPIAVGTIFTMEGTFDDPDSEDTHIATWNWGDGSESPGDVSDGTVTGQYAYSIPGVYTITLTVEDAAGESDTATYQQYIVIYDPTGAFITGGGWINSPLGAIPEQPEIIGKASFGFISKYHHGAITPGGNTQFKFKAGDIQFHSTAYDWMVVAGAKAQFKGTGTINDMGEFKFMIWATDGALLQQGGGDSFRIKIWEEDEFGAETVIYDNKEETELGGGSIKIHKG